MLHITAVIRIQPEHEAAAAKAMQALAAGSRTEKGCIRYDVFQRHGEAVFLTQEVWTDAEAEAVHMKGPYVAALLAAIGGILAGAPDVYHCQQIG
jgi:quinol monooxygenase YgiN